MNSMMIRSRESSPDSTDLGEIKKMGENPKRVREYLEEVYREKSVRRVMRLLEKVRGNTGFELYRLEELGQI